MARTKETATMKRLNRHLLQSVACLAFAHLVVSFLAGCASGGECVVAD
jgi:hypothetical protein